MTEYGYTLSTVTKRMDIMRAFTYIVLSVLVIGLNANAAMNSNKVELQDVVSKIAPGAIIDAVQPSKLPGFNDVLISGQNLFISNDGKYVILGSVLDLSQPQGQWELGTNLLQEYRVQVMSSLPGLLVYKPKIKAKARVMVFTDIDCPTCERFHNDVNKLLDAGIEVDYVAFPRHGIGSDSYYKAVSVWCAKDQQAAMSLAMSNSTIAKATCNNPIEKHVQAGVALAIRGVPSYVFENGKIAMGYMQVQQLAQLAIENGKGGKL